MDGQIRFVSADMNNVPSYKHLWLLTRGTVYFHCGALTLFWLTAMGDRCYRCKGLQMSLDSGGLCALTSPPSGCLLKTGVSVVVCCPSVWGCSNCSITPECYFCQANLLPLFMNCEFNKPAHIVGLDFGVMSVPTGSWTSCFMLLQSTTTAQSWTLTWSRSWAFEMTFRYYQLKLVYDQWLQVAFTNVYILFIYAYISEFMFNSLLYVCLLFIFI